MESVTIGGPTAISERVVEIEAQPLDARAVAFSALHDELSRDLESGDAPRDA